MLNPQEDNAAFSGGRRDPGVQKSRVRRQFSSERETRSAREFPMCGSQGRHRARVVCSQLKEVAHNEEEQGQG